MTVDRLPLMFAYTEPDRGCDDAFNRWYDGVHIPQVLATPGLCAVQRFRFEAHPEMSRARYRYLAIYELDTNDIPAVQAALRDRAPTLTRFDGIHKPPFVQFYRPIAG